MSLMPILDTLSPLLGSLAGIGTIVRVYLITKESGHIPEGVSTPPISFFGCNSPERDTYQIGFLLTGLLLMFSLERWRRIILPLLMSFGLFSPLIMLLGGYMAPFGVAAQGLLTLEEDLLLHLKQGRKLQPQSIIHQRVAAIFFLGAAAHCYTTAYYIIATSRSKGSGNDGSKPTPPCLFGPWSKRLKLFCVLLSVLSYPIAHLLHPARTSTFNRRHFDIAGLAQYIVVGSYIVFFGSYSLDFRYVHTNNMVIKGRRKVKRS